MSDEKLSNFPLGSFAPGVGVQWEDRDLIAVPDTNVEGGCEDCFFALEPEDGTRALPANCPVARSENGGRICSSVRAGKLFNHTVRFLDHATYAKLRIKGKL